MAKDNSGCWYASILLALIPFSVWWRAYVLATLWAWLVVPAFHAVPITLGAAMAAQCVWSFLAYRPHDEAKDRESLAMFSREITRMFTIPVFYLACGYAVKVAEIRGWITY